VAWFQPDAESFPGSFPWFGAGFAQGGSAADAAILERRATPETNDSSRRTMAEICPICEGSGLRVVQREGRQFAVDCECRVRERSARRLGRAGIPRRYEHCTLESYETNFPSSHRSLGAALLRAKRFVESYPLETAGTGLLLTGTIGVGKTHLAVGILQSLVEERGASGLFYDYRDLLKQVQNSYNPQVRETELEVLRPVFEAEVLVLDELGAAKPTDWVWDTVAHILNTRYNDRRTTIITTNYPNFGPLGTESGPRGVMREETLGDRIGERMRSRLQEMCVVVEMQGEDFRQKVKRASFA
jgi:DNA replication protein DnaC